MVDTPKFNSDNAKFPGLLQPHETYHPISYPKHLPQPPYITKPPLHFLPHLPSPLSPFNLHQFLIPLQTLHLPLQPHSQNPLPLPQYLQQHPKLTSLNYPALKNNPYHQLPQKYLPD
ncbi:PLP-dependent transferase, partial [Staphylococcus saprophyticus]|uniref:PLP-dependent transferase n=1 Tax=Staphylococcus saprophyticus TaxID=29385 RepID=UPI0028CB4B8E